MSHSFEQLERRSLLSAASAAVDSMGILQITGTDGDDAIHLATANSTLVATINGQSTGFAAADVAGIVVQAGDGNDIVSIDSTTLQPATLLGQDGNDSLTSGGGVATLRGGAGSDTLTGGAHLNNTADFSDVTDDLGYDSQASAQVTYAHSDDTDTIQGDFARFVSGSGNDRINLLHWQFIDGGAGNDRLSINGNGGTVTLHGGAGDDQLGGLNSSAFLQAYGDAGNDTFTLDRDSNTTHEFFGGDGIDTLDVHGVSSSYDPFHISLDDVANDGNSYNNENNGRHYTDNVHSDIEVIVSGNSSDIITGSDHNETIIGGGGSDSIDGGGGDDVIIDGDSNSSRPTLNGGGGNDTISADSFNDRITMLGGSGDDVITSNRFSDYIDGGTGNDHITDSGGSQEITGGAGTTPSPRSTATTPSPAAAVAIP